MSSNAAGTIITVGIVGALGYWLYENFFSAPASTTPVTTTPATTNPANGAGTHPAATTPAGPCSPTNFLNPLLAKVQALPDVGQTYGPNLPGAFTIDEWAYYANQLCTGIPEQYGLTADHLFPGKDDRGGPINWNAFSGYAKNAGLSGMGLRLRQGRRMIGTHAIRRLAA